MVDDGWWWLMMVADGSLVGGWPTPLKMMEFVSWDDEIPKMMGKLKFMFQTTNQLETIKRYIYI